MRFDDGERNNLYENLLKQGVPRAQIEKVYRGLREKGYGEEEARRRSHAELAREKTLAPQRPGTEHAQQRKASPSLPRAAPIPERRKAPELPKSVAPEAAKRAIDWLPEVPPWLRRRINRYAWRNGFLITRLLERVEDFLSHFDPTREDYVSGAFLRLLVERRGHREGNPYTLSFLDNLDLLRQSALTLLGREPGHQEGGERLGADQSNEVARAIASREPFALEFFGEFTKPEEMLRRSLDFLASRLAAGVRVRVAETARVVKDGGRLIVMTEAVERDKLETLFDVVREVNLAIRPGDPYVGRIADAEGLFRAAYQNLRRYSHEMYPALLKMIASFYEEDDASAEKRALVLSFLGLREDEILTWEGWQRKAREEREKALVEQRARELERLEQEKTQKFSARFEGTLGTLSSLFPDSGIERVEQGEYLLPYFVNRVFTHTALFQSRLADMEHIASSDIMGPVMVFHAILDDLLSSVEPYAAETAMGRETLAGELITLRTLWAEAYGRLFDPYLDEIREFARELGGEARFVRMFRESQRARGIEERINHLRNRAIRNFGHVIVDHDYNEGSKLYELAARLSDLLSDVGQIVNQDLLAAQDPVRKRVAGELGARKIVDFVARSRTSSPDYRPVTRQVRRWIEARFKKPVLDIPVKSQVAFMDAFRGTAELYNFLVNDPQSFAASASHGVVVASKAEAEKWAREKGTRGRGAAESLQVTLKEEFPGRFADPLTGLKNKDYFLNELPALAEKLKAQGKRLTLLMIDIDHFKWVNDELGHARGDEVLKSTGQTILDSVREGDLAVRYGGEELLVVIPSDLHTGIILAERLRFAQEQEVRNGDAMADVRSLEELLGEPCGTLSIGVADVTAVQDMARAVEKSDGALYFAKKTRNTVAFLSGTDHFSTYAEYRQRTGRVSG
ncbi:MAG TPA: GGDEF domain-containing protein [Spirochaetia bacterium]|nr:GGDEF domain-containing protein [Spirochaetia bacterium]